MRGGPVARGSRYAVRLVAGRRLDAECVGKSNEKAEQGGHIGGLGDLLIGPAHIAQALDLLVGDAVGRPGYGAGEFQQQALGRIRPAASRSPSRSASAPSNSLPCNCRNHVCELSQYLQRLRAET